MKKKRVKIKWGNIGIFWLFIVCLGLVISDFITIAMSLASFTFYGATTGILALVIMSITGEYLYNEMNKKKIYKLDKNL